jgi:flavin-dependent dehydrogenase
MIGDSAGLIHPLCGNGMAMAIHSAKICAESTISFFNKSASRKQFEENYVKEWNKHFKRRLQIGKVIAKAFNEEKLTEPIVKVLNSFPALLPLIIKQTHGKPIQI